MLKFQNVKIKNFLSVGNDSISIDLDTHTITSLSGANGAGKSLFIDAIFFALYGKTFRKLTKSQIVNSINKKLCSVILTFSNNGRTYQVTRGISPTLFDITVDGEPIKTLSSLAKQQEWLEQNALQVNKKTLEQTVFIGSRDYAPFMTLTTADRRLVVEELLDIKVFSVMNNLLKSKVKTNKQLLVDVRTAETNIKQKIDMQKKHIEDMQSKNDEIVNEYKQSIQDAETKLSVNKSKCETLTTNIDALTNSIDIDGLEANKRKFETGMNIINRNINEYKSKISFYADNNNCPTCRQELEQSFVETELDKFKTLENENVTKLELISAKFGEVARSLVTAIDVQKQVRTHQNELSALNGENTALNSTIASCKRSIETLLAKDDTQTGDTGVLDKLVEGYEKAIDKKNTLSETLIYQNYVLMMLKDDGIKSRIVNNYIPVLNKLLAKYLDVQNFNCEFTFDENFNETIKSRYRDVFGYNNFSNGQKLRIDLAILFSFRELSTLKNSADTNLLVLDEVAGAVMDFDGKDTFNALVVDCAKKSNVFVITHDEDFKNKSFIDRKLNFVLSQSFTEVEIETSN